MREIILMLSIMILFISCGGNSENKKKIDDNKTEESNLTTPPKNTTVDYTIPLKYEYNKDGSATQKLAPLYVNQYKEVQKKLNETKSDSVEFYSVLSGYIGDLYRGTDSLGTIPSYAPSGESKSQVVIVTNGQIDYSSYKLKGDVDFNWEVDFRDLKLLSEAILNDVDSFQYDVNGDGNVDTADVVDVVSRFGNEIKYFDFYTVNGTKLSVDTRSSNDEKSFAYGGSETQIMVVAKDRNHASAYESGLSDIGDVWYKKDGWSLKQTLPSVSTDKLLKSNRKLFKNSVTNWEFNDLGKISIAEYLENHPYLVGWTFSLTAQLSAYHGGLSNDKSLMVKLDEEPLYSYLQLMETEIMSHFSTTDMNHPPIRNINSEKYSYKIGALIDKKYNQMQGLSLDAVYTNSTTDETIDIRYVYLWEMSIYSSPKSYMLTGELTRSDEKEAKGTVVVGRIGPGKKEDILTGEIEDSIFSVENASFGTYNINYLDECSCSNDLGEYIFDKEGKTPEYKLKSTKVKTKLQLLDKENEPINKKTIKIVAKPCVNSDDDEKSFSSVSDANGYVDFSNVPIGDYNVYVDGKENSEIHFCEAYNGKLRGKKLWDIDFKYVSKSTGGKSSDFEGTANWHWKKIQIPSITDSINNIETATTLFESGEFPYPLRYTEEGTVIINLTNTTFFDKAKDGLGLHYIERSPISSMSKRYCITLDAGLFHNDYSGYFFSASCGEDIAFGSRTIDTSLNNTHINAMKEYREFTVQSTGSWTNGEGETTMTINFRPSK